MVWRACKKALFEPGDTGQQWKGKPRLVSLSKGSPVAALPTSGAGYWSPFFSCDSFIDKRLRSDVFLRGCIFWRKLSACLSSLSDLFISMRLAGEHEMLLATRLIIVAGHNDRT